MDKQEQEEGPDISFWAAMGVVVVCLAVVAGAFIVPVVFFNG